LPGHRDRKALGRNRQGSKIKGYAQKHQWAFAELETFLGYKAGLAGVEHAAPAGLIGDPLSGKEVA
jgi:transposase